MKRGLFFILCLAAPWIINGCFNPFFPETGTPPPVESSPERTVQLLREAYEQMDIYSFEKLIYSTADYSSFTQVADDYTSGLVNFLFKPKVFIDSIFMPNRFLPQNRFYYELRWEQERRIHERMFDLSDEIVFLSPLVSGETLFETHGEDTLSALVKTQPSQIRVKVGGQEFVTDVSGQIFAMKKDGGVWKIWKWIELN